MVKSRMEKLEAMETKMDWDMLSSAKLSLDPEHDERLLSSHSEAIRLSHF